jgi:Flp pilus assembly protein TadG
MTGYGKIKARLADRTVDESGQSLVEFALMFTILTIILMGILDLGRAYYAYIALQDAVGEGAAYASMNPACVAADSGPGTCSDPNNITFRTMAASPAGMVISSSIDVGVIYDTRGITLGVPITVTAAYRYPLITPVIGSIVGSNVLLLQAQAQRPIGSP